ncbi:hypothetical protein K469DRAFT_572215 [Zopfia rhizophila CBS 207.26]|uniref:Uncharacterized protein n=1 Tax=Zopfia rhizophila CBS 207.26 TaxID=1314779 RepID=A0A6A6E471_9PEZI|nr:hypothetical protein K469DRAFT_572215 [Zopfia rhizophila CBS 207.26]
MVHNQVDHQFTFPELEWDAPESYQRNMHKALFLQKLLNIDNNHFQMHCNHVHSDPTVASKNFNVAKIQRYVQVRYNSPR